MSNKLLTPTQVLREAQRVLHNNLVFVKNVNKQYSSEFALSGAKVGSTINVRLPNRYCVSKTTALQAQNTNESTVPLSLTTNYQVGLNFTQAELTLTLDDFSKRVLSPAMARLASQIDQDGLGQTVNIYNQVGTPGTTPGVAGGSFTDDTLNYNAPDVYLNAGMMLDNMAAPRDDNRRCVLNPAAMAKSVAGLKGLFQDAGEIAKQYRKGVIGTALGFEFAMARTSTSWPRAATRGRAAPRCPARARRARSWRRPAGRRPPATSSTRARSSPSRASTASTRKTSRTSGICSGSWSPRAARPMGPGTCPYL